jgi:hypothetical protein
MSSSKIVYLTISVADWLYFRIKERAGLANRTVEEEVVTVLTQAFPADKAASAGESSDRR